MLLSQSIASGQRVKTLCHRNRFKPWPSVPIQRWPALSSSTGPASLLGMSFVGGVGCYFAVCELVEAVLRAGPKAAFAIDIERQNQAMGKAIASAIHADFAIAVTADAVVRTNPDTSVGPFCERRDGVIGQTVAHPRKNARRPCRIWVRPESVPAQTLPSFAQASAVTLSRRANVRIGVGLESRAVPRLRPKSKPATQRVPSVASQVDANLIRGQAIRGSEDVNAAVARRGQSLIRAHPNAHRLIPACETEHTIARQPFFGRVAC